MGKARWSALLVTAVVVLAYGAATLIATTPSTVSRPATATSTHAVHDATRVVFAGLTLARGSRQVRLVLPREPLTAAESVPVTIINAGARPIYRSLRFVLERRTSRGLKAIDRSDGVRVAFPIWTGVVQAAHSREPEQLPLYDDLRPGSYRITLFYRPVPKSWRVIPPLTSRDRSVRLLIVVHDARQGPKPQLPETTLLQIAEHAAASAGDPHPTLIQHAAGTHFDAARIASGDLVFEWNWSYLIAERGHFRYVGLGPANVRITGSVLTQVVDAATGQVTDAGLSKRYPDLRRLGRVTTDLRH
jgi:hypothetical protein